MFIALYARKITSQITSRVFYEIGYPIKQTGFNKLSNKQGFENLFHKLCIYFYTTGRLHKLHISKTKLTSVLNTIKT